MPGLPLSRDQRLTLIDSIDFRARGLSRRQWRAVRELLRQIEFCSTRGHCVARVEVLAKRMGVTRRSVQLARAQAEAAGLLCVNARRTSHGQASNSWEIRWESIGDTPQLVGGAMIAPPGAMIAPPRAMIAPRAKSPLDATPPHETTSDDKCRVFHRQGLIGSIREVDRHANARTREDRTKALQAANAIANRLRLQTLSPANAEFVMKLALIEPELDGTVAAAVEAAATPSVRDPLAYLWSSLEDRIPDLRRRLAEITLNPPSHNAADGAARRYA